ncbi:MAG: prolipoprotein diacylglyceryl transferase [Tissierellia bacterium]|nr:prolipoprotein diacylglyceryl transferase [Tissierellia bacterium]
MQYTGSRVAFSIFGIDVYWYGILIVTGMVLATVLSVRELNRKGYKGDVIYDLALWVLPAAIIGARIYYVIFEWDQFNGDIVKIVNMRDGGLAIHGGVLAALLVGYFFTKKRSIDFLLMSDVIMIFLPLAQAIGRWGNFVNNEAHGGPTNLPWALIIDGQKYHPTFLYESVCNFILAMVLWYLFRNGKTKRGYTTSLYLIVYGVVRFFIESLRTDSLWIGPLRQAQVISVVFVVVGVILYMWAKRSNKDYGNIE